MFQGVRTVFGHRTAAATALLTGALALLASLVSFSAADPVPFFGGASDLPTRNWLGPAGALLAALALRTLGGASFALPLILADAGRRRLPGARRPTDGASVRAVSLGSLLVCATGLAALAEALVRGDAGSVAPWGGHFGAIVASTLSAGLHPLGATLVLVAIGVISFGALVGRIPGADDSEPAAASPLARLRARLRDRRKARARRLEARRNSRQIVARIQLRRPRNRPEETAGPATDSSADAGPPRPKPRRPKQPDLLPSPPPDRKPRERSAPAAAVAGDWKLPSLQLLTRRAHQTGPSRKTLETRRKALEAACAEYGVRGQVERIQPGPVVTTFEFRLGEGETLRKLSSRHEEICMALHAPAIRVQRVRGKGVVGIEVPNETASVVGLREVLESSEFQEDSGALPVGIGRLVDGRALVRDLAEMPHLLIAGATGAGKSVQINTLLCSLLARRTPDELRLILIDPKRVELRPYRSLPHLLTPLILEPEKAKTVLFHACRELERRTRVLEEHGMRNISGYNQMVQRAAGDPKASNDAAEPLRPMPRLVIVIDELADLFIHARAEVTPYLQRLLSLGRAEGIHLVLATQRPSTDVVSGTLKANLPTRIAFRVASYVDSRTILDRIGAEMLLGKGDMLMMRPGADLPRAQGAFVDDREVGRLTRFWEEAAEPVFDEAMLASEDEAAPGSTAKTAATTVGAGGGPVSGGGGAADAMLPRAREIFVREQKASTSMLQTDLGLGYQRARRIVAELEKQGVVGPARGAQPREVIAQQ